MTRSLLTHDHHRLMAFDLIGRGHSAGEQSEPRYLKEGSWKQERLLRKRRRLVWGGVNSDPEPSLS